MLKKTITYTDYNEDEVTEDFYFNFTKLELIEKLQIEDLEARIKRLTKTSEGPESYAILKSVILDAYGIKSADGKRFEKSREIRAQFESSPAFSEFMFELFENPARASEFIEACLPAKLVKEVKAAQAAQEAAKKTEEITPAPELPTAPPQLEETSLPDVSTDMSSPTKRDPLSYTRKELLDMSDEDFRAAAGNDPLHMPSRMFLEVAMQRRNRE